MPKFLYYQDAKVITWQRTYFEVEASTQKQADQTACQMLDSLTIDDMQEGVSIDRTEVNFAASEFIPCDQNGGRPTVEIHNDDTGETIADNSLNPQP